MAYSQEVREYAKELFLTVGENGEHKYTLQEICDQIGQKFDGVQKLRKQTVQTWATKKDKSTEKSWADIWDSGQRHGIQEAQREYDKKLSAEEKLTLQVDRITSLRAGNAIRAAENVKAHLIGEKPMDPREALGQWKMSETTFNNLNLEAIEDNQLEINHNVILKDIRPDLRGNLAEILIKIGSEESQPP